MSNLTTKYSAILDGLDYGYSVNRQKPDDMNIICALGDLYGTKLAGSQLPATERSYYERRVQSDTMAPIPLSRFTLPQTRLEEFLSAAHAAGMDEPSDALEADEQARTISATLPRQVADRLAAVFSGPGVSVQALPMPKTVANVAVRRNHLDPMLSDDGNIRPELLQVTHPRPAAMSQDAAWYDGSELQYLRPFQPFPYGLSPDALGYNEFKRCQTLQRVDHESHIQNSDFVIDSRPCLALESWAKQTGDDGRRAELRFFGLDDRGERLDLQVRGPGADGKVGPHMAAMLATQPDPAAGPRAIFQYALSARLWRQARLEYQAHIQLFPGSHDRFASHIDDTIGFEQLALADHDFLRGLLDSADKKAAWAAARDEYTQAAQQFELVILRYFVEDDLVLQTYPRDSRGVALRRDAIDQVPPEQRRAVLDAVVAATAVFYKAHQDEYGDDRREYVSYINRGLSRIAAINGD
jgi:hypothetical protein